MAEERVSGSSGFGLLLRRYRLAAGLSQEALAERARMSTHGISALERGYRRTPQRETLELLAAALDLDDEARQAFEGAAVRTGGVRRGGAAAQNGLTASADESNLPLALTSFVGREVELGEIATLLREHRLVTLTGSGGVGKTQTALQAANAVRVGGESIVSYVPLAPVGDPAFVLSAMASALGVRASSDVPLLDVLLTHLKEKRLLLILDNCEHVVDQAAILAHSILGSCAGIRILATSREPLRVPGEQTYRLPSLSLASAIELFNDRARAVDHHFAMTDESATTVSDICRHLDGIPLAIELAAARVNLFSVKAINERLRDRFWLLTGGERTALPRQQTMRAAIDWSYDLLCGPEQRLFERLSVFAGSATFEAAAALYVMGEAGESEILEALSSLVDKSLVVADFERDEPRYGLLESFKEYARQKLTERGDEQLVAGRHATACLRAAESSLNPLDLPDDLDNWRAALRWALNERNNVVLGQKLVPLLPLGMMPAEGRQWVSLASDLISEDTPREVVAALRQADAWVAFTLRQYKAAVTACLDAILLFRDLGDWRRVVRAQDMAGHALTSLGRVEEARALIEEALAISRDLNDNRFIAWTLRCLAYCCARSGDFDEARRYISEVIPVYEREFDSVDLAYAINDFGMYQFCAGDAALALASATKMYGIASETGDARCIATALNAMSVYLLSSARYGEAQACAKEALELARAHHLDVLGCYALQQLAAVAALDPFYDGEPPEERLARAAHLLGFVDSRLNELGSAQLITQEREREQLIAALRSAMGPDRLKELTEAGSALTAEQAIMQASAS